MKKVQHFHGSFRPNWHLTKAEIQRLPMLALRRRVELLTNLIGTELETWEMQQELDWVLGEIEKRKEEYA